MVVSIFAWAFVCTDKENHAPDEERYRSLLWQEEERESSMRQRRILFMLASLCCLLTACTSGSTQVQKTPTPTQPPTATATSGVSRETLLYQSDWSKGIKGWGTTNWSIVEGAAQSNLSRDNILTVPYTVPVPNYAFECRFQIVQVPRDGGQIFLRAVKSSAQDGYIAGILDLLSPTPHPDFDHPQIQLYLDPLQNMDQPMQTVDYDPGTIWHTFRVEVRGETVDFITDGLHKGYAASVRTSPLSNGPLQVVASGAVVRVSSVQITAL